MKRLRLLHIQVQAVLVWDDGETLTPGPPLNPFTVTSSQLEEMPQRLRAELAKLCASLEAGENGSETPAELST